MAGYVLDASVIVEIFVSGTYADEGLQLLERAGTAGIRLYAPDAIYYEVAAALRKHELKADYKQMGEDIADFVDLDIAVTASKELLFEAVEIAQKHQLSVYDSFYLALSQRLKVPLVTTDMRLANGVAGKPFQVIHVSAAVLP